MNAKRTEAQKINTLNAEGIFSIMQKILLRENEIAHDKRHFWIVGLTNDNRVLFIELVSLDSVEVATIKPSNVFRVAVLKNAAKVILVHNTPSDELTPSEADKVVTEYLIQVGKIIGVEIIDHLIITSQSFLSFADTGLFTELQQSLAWMPPFEAVKKRGQEESKINQEMVQVAEKGKQEEEIEGVSELSVKEVEKS